MQPYKLNKPTKRESLISDLGFVKEPGLRQQQKRIVRAEVTLQVVDAMFLQRRHGVLLGRVQGRHYRFRTGVSV